MSAKKTHRKKRAHPSRKSLAFGLLVSFFILLMGYVFISSRHSPDTEASETFSFKAAIVDHLSLTAPNPSFIQEATEILEDANFTVQYYGGEEVTVEFYRNLPTLDYGLIILRVHSAWEPIYQTISLFTCEPYSKTSYIYEQVTYQIGRAAFEPYHEGDPEYFAITQNFVQLSMRGRFKNTILIMMGCNGLETTTMAEAFIAKGAKVYISWNKLVSSSHTDTATTNLLQHLLTQKQTIEQSVSQTMRDVGPDPLYESTLLYYPLEAGDYTIKTHTQNTLTIITEIKEATKTTQHKIK